MTDTSRHVPEVIYAVRRADGQDIGDYSFVVVSGPGDWTPAEDDADGIDDATVYQLVKMTVEVVATRTLPECSEAGCETPASHWGLCEAHAREDDPDYFAEANRTRSATEGTDG